MNICNTCHRKCRRRSMCSFETGMLFLYTIVHALFVIYDRRRAIPPYNGYFEPSSLLQYNSAFAGFLLYTTQKSNYISIRLFFVEFAYSKFQTEI